MTHLAPGVELGGPPVAGVEEILTAEAAAFLGDLERRFRDERAALLRRRAERHARIAAGERPDFLASTAEIRRAGWQVAAAPADLDDRRVEITGPAEPKMMINALNSGASVFMADLEDALSPGWANIVGGQLAIRDAVRRDLSFETPDKAYRLADTTATLVVRPRGWHLEERHLLVDGAPMSASLFDAGLYLFHDAAAALASGTGPYLYLPKLESHLEARLWNDVFLHAQAAVGIPRGSVRATVLIETILAAFEMDEILYELREHAAGLNAGRWDYLFSVIKRFRDDPAFVFPDRGQVTMAVPFMRAYTAPPRRDVPPARRPCDRRHVRVHPQPARARGHGQRAREGPRGQGARGGRRVRRHVGRPPGPRAGRARGVRPGARRPAEPEGPPPASAGVRAAALLDVTSPAAASPWPASARTSASACATSPRGWAATVPPRSTT